MMNRIGALLFFIFIYSSAFSQFWKNVGGGIPSASVYDGIYCMAVDTTNNVLYAGGAFSQIGSINANNVAMWDGISWSPLGVGTVNDVTTIAVLNNEVYVANNTQNKVRKWNGSSWTTLPNFAAGSHVHVLSVVNGELYAGGSFSYSAAGMALHGIARWTGTTWDSVGHGFNSVYYVNDIVGYQGKLVAGGLFQVAGFDSVRNIAIWNDTLWSTLGEGVYANGNLDCWVNCLFSDDINLYAGGTFLYAGNDTVNGIAKWDGSLWFPMDSGAYNPFGSNPEVVCISKFNSHIYAIGGFFNTSSTDEIAMWDGSSWVPKTNNLLGSKCDMGVFSSELFVCGFRVDTLLSVTPLRDIVRLLSNTISFSNSTCGTNCNGTATATAIGVAPPTYLWSNGATTQTVTGLCAGNYSVTVIDASSSPSLGSVTISAPPQIGSFVNTNICVGEVYDFNGVQLSSEGTYHDTLNAANGCDSVITLTLSLLSPSQTSFSQSICEGEVFDFDGMQLTNAGTYYDTLNAANGCDSVVTLTLSVNTVTATVAISNDTLVASWNGAVQWYDCNEQHIINGETDSIYVPTASGNYAAIITNGNCSDTTQCVFYDGINSFAPFNSTFIISPNPVSDELTIKILNGIAPKQIEVVNELGEKVLQLHQTKPTSLINIHPLPSGIYFIKVQMQNGELLVKKFIKQ